MKTKLIITSLLTALSLPVHAEVYMCKINGKPVFQDKQCDGFVILSNGNMIPTKDHKAPPTPGELLLITQNEKAEAEKRAKELRWSSALNKNIRRDVVVIGMDADDLIWSMGEPSKINESVGRWGKHEQFIYRNSNIKYIYVQNGKVTSWQAAN